MRQYLTLLIAVILLIAGMLIGIMAMWLQSLLLIVIAPTTMLSGMAILNHCGLLRRLIEKLYHLD